MEMIMSAIYGAPATAQGIARYFPDNGLAAPLKRWWAACLASRGRQAAMVALCAMNDRELRDIGLTRCDIPRAVRGDVERDPTFRRNG
jgi:uncharacterized protein YjiS (DUF1127 family)